VRSKPLIAQSQIKRLYAQQKKAYLRISQTEID
jgi:hypothetical protein